MKWLTAINPDEPTMAHFIVKIPFQLGDRGEVLDAALYLCTADARWAAGDVVGSPLVNNTDNMVFHGRIKRTRPRTINLASTLSSFLPERGPFWRTITMKQDWLETLTPKLGGENQTDWTTLAKAFTAAGFDNSTGIVSGWAALGDTIESTVAVTIVDGLSRLGLEDNGANTVHVMPERYQWLHFTPIETPDGQVRNVEWRRLLSGGYDIVEKPEGYEDAELTKLAWSASISGYAFKADSVPYFLALSVLLVHSILAIVHCLYIICTRCSSDAWESLEEMLALSQNSKPGSTTLLRNTCGGMLQICGWGAFEMLTIAGILRGATWRRRARIAVVNEANGIDEPESIQLLFEDDVRNNANDCHRPVADVSYGAGDPVSTITLQESFKPPSPSRHSRI